MQFLKHGVQTVGKIALILLKSCSNNSLRVRVGHI